MSREKNKEAKRCIKRVEILDEKNDRYEQRKTDRKKKNYIKTLESNSNKL